MSKPKDDILHQMYIEHDHNASALARTLEEPRTTVRGWLRRLDISIPQTNVEAIRTNLDIYKSEPKSRQLVLQHTGPMTTDLLISDLQIPFHHPDAFDFLEALDEKYKFNRIINVGDFIDANFAGFYDRDPNLPSPSDEIHYAQEGAAQLADLFPDMVTAEGNHDMRIYRAAEKAGIPKSCVKSLNSILKSPPTWKWAPEIVLKFPNKTRALVVHNCGHRDAIKGVFKYGMSVIQGHYHSLAEVRYVASLNGLMFGMTVGSLIDDNALAFSYNRLHTTRPVLSVGIIKNGVPRIVPMQVNSKGRWVGKL